MTCQVINISMLNSTCGELRELCFPPGSKAMNAKFRTCMINYSSKESTISVLGHMPPRLLEPLLKKTIKSPLTKKSCTTPTLAYNYILLLTLTCQKKTKIQRGKYSYQHSVRTSRCVRAIRTLSSLILSEESTY